MYSIYADDICIYNDISPLEELKLYSPKLVLEDSAAGSLSMTVPVTNAGYSVIKRLVTDIVVKKDNNEIWAGRVVSEDRDFANSRILYCEGELAFLSDTLQPQMEYHYKTERFIDMLLHHHNEKVSFDKRFEAGIVTVPDNNSDLYRFTNFETTIECIKDKLLARLGGHLRVRKADGVRYLDYIDDNDMRISSQTIDFGRNLIDLTRKWEYTDMATVIVPLGAKLDESVVGNLESYVTIESVNNESRKSSTEKPPFSFYTSGDELMDYRIFGADGGVGDYDPVTGKYKITVEVESHNFFLGDLPRQTVNGLTFEMNYNHSLTGSFSVRGTATKATHLCVYDGSENRFTGFNYRRFKRGVFYISYRVEDGSSGSFAMSLKYDSDNDDHSDAHTLTVNPYPSMTKIDNSDDSKSYVCPYITIPSGATVDFTVTVITTERTNAEILLDKPLIDKEYVDYSDIGVPIRIPRIDPEAYPGEVIKYLSFSTEVQPSKMYLLYGTSSSNKLYVQSDEAMKNYGWIEKTVHWEDVHTPSILLRKAKKYLSNYQFDEMGIELSAIDLHYLDVDIEDVRLLDKIRVVSPLHGMDRYFPVTKLEIPLDDPTGTIFSLGAKEGKTLTQSLNDIKQTK